MADGNIENYLGNNLIFPVSKDTIKAEAIANNASDEMLDAIDKMKSDEFFSYNDVSSEFNAA